jgi:hypothetical protein
MKIRKHRSRVVANLPFRKKQRINSLTISRAAFNFNTGGNLNRKLVNVSHFEHPLFEAKIYPLAVINRTILLGN